jgi:DNA-binding MarR family transcriptional regulator
MVANELAFLLVGNIGPAQLAQTLEVFVRRLLSLTESEGFDALVGTELSFSQARTVFLLACSDAPVPINEIADRLGLSEAAAGRNVDQLVRLELANRHESDVDRRVKLVSLSPAGEHIAMSHMQTKLKAIRTFASDLSPDLRSTLCHTLQSILDGDALRPKKPENTL